MKRFSVFLMATGTMLLAAGTLVVIVAFIYWLGTLPFWEGVLGVVVFFAVITGGIIAYGGPDSWMEKRKNDHSELL